MVRREDYPVDKTRVDRWMDSISEYTRHGNIDQGILTGSTLVVIDMQNFFIQESSHAGIPAAKKIVPNINKLISEFSTNGRLVIFTRHALAESDSPGVMANWWKDTLYDDTPEAELYSELEIPENSVVLRKTTYDAFHNTELYNILKENEVRSLVVTGVMTHLCCETTARVAFVNNFFVFFVVDATATTNEELHISTLKTLSDGFAVPCTTEMLISKKKT